MDLEFVCLLAFAGDGGSGSVRRLESYQCYSFLLENCF